MRTKADEDARNLAARIRRQARIADYITQCDNALYAELERSNGVWPDSLLFLLFTTATEHAPPSGIGSTR
jgi:hypothetical protein